MTINEDLQPQTKEVNLEYTGERHIAGQLGVDLLSFANLEHMIRYALIAPFVQGKRVLDISCGSGYGTQYIAMQNASQVVGVDIDQESIDFARKYHGHKSITYIQSDAHHVKQLEDASFDTIISFETIEHLQKPREFLLELRRLLNPDSGQMFISCPNDYRVTPWISEFHVHKFRFNEFRDLIVSIFGKATFIGQHHAIASCLIKPIIPNEVVSQFENYKNMPPHDFFTGQYLEHISSIDNADGYLAFVGVEPSLIPNSFSLSQNAFQAIMSELTNYEAKANQAVNNLKTCQEKFTLDLETRAQEYQQNIVNNTDKFQNELSFYKEKFQKELKFHQQQAQIEISNCQQQAQIEIANYQQQIQIELQAAKTNIQAKEILIFALEEKVKALEERYGKLLREKFNLANVPSEFENKLSQMESALLQAQTRIAAMETSKFWKFRKTWFKFKRMMNIPGDE
ncbi:MAG: methyltransferase domain-containing protein [Scytonematopsis contorta HA4267-MV1]|jgi:2-polyprenyl-3-methyl-5-hydroxy-6-metoxy-1,4-benzoquinol methylase|nr:methyltransferase domain-containing protein [Scytonematopsis contorta HA4267-MV1]